MLTVSSSCSEKASALFAGESALRSLKLPPVLSRARLYRILPRRSGLSDPRFPDDARQPLAEFSQYPVASLVAVGIVDAFEMVYVQHQQT